MQQIMSAFQNHPSLFFLTFPFPKRISVWLTGTVNSCKLVFSLNKTTHSWGILWLTFILLILSHTLLICISLLTFAHGCCASAAFFFFQANDFFLLQPLRSGCTHNTFQSWFPLSKQHCYIYCLCSAPVSFPSYSIEVLESTSQIYVTAIGKL